MTVIIDKTQQKQKNSAEVSENSGSSWVNSVNEDQQLSLFPEESLYLDELRKLNLNDMTPLHALNYLHELTNNLRQ